MTAVEKIARAMATASGYSMFDDLRPYMQERFRWMALAAIKAMREPSERMLHHMVGYTDFCLDRCFWGEGETDTQRMMAGQRQEMKTAWTVAIDAAIAEHEGRE